MSNVIIIFSKMSNNVVRKVDILNYYLEFVLQKNGGY